MFFVMQLSCNIYLCFGTPIISCLAMFYLAYVIIVTDVVRSSQLPSGLHQGIWQMTDASAATNWNFRHGIIFLEGGPQF